MADWQGIVPRTAISRTIDWIQIRHANHLDAKRQTKAATSAWPQHAESVLRASAGLVGGACNL